MSPTATHAALPAHRTGERAPLVHAVIPAHDEADELPRTLGALGAQVPMDRVLVVADNCTDDTAQIARNLGANVHETVGNTFKKAGALNQALAALLPTLEEDDAVLVLDADTIMAPRFVEAAMESLAESSRRGAVGGIFMGEPPTSLLEIAQANEYARYAREIERTRRVQVLTGTASIIRVEALREIAAARGTRITGHPGEVYDRDALTEDMELTLALGSLGWSLASPAECLTTTQLMPTVKALQEQRIRWYRGAIDNLRSYGWTKVTRRYVFQQVMLAIGVVAMALYLMVMTADVALGLVAFSPFWTLVGVLFAVERTVTAWGAGWKGRIFAALLVPEIVYDIMLQIAFVRATTASLRGAEAVWHHNTARTA